MIHPSMTKAPMNAELEAAVQLFVKRWGNYDRVSVDTDGHDRLIAWKNANKELVRENRMTPLAEGLISYVLDINNGVGMEGMYQYFKSPSEDDPEGYMLVFAKPPGQEVFPVLAFSFAWDIGGVKVYDEWTHPNFYPIMRVDEDDTPTQSAVTMYCTTMAYMAHFKEVRERIGSASRSMVTKKKPKHGQKKSKAVRRAHRIEYKLLPPTIEELQKDETEKRERAKPSGSWVVKGHPRTYGRGTPNERTIFIKPYPKGEGRRESTEYRV